VFCGHCEFCLSGHLSICQTPEVKMAPGVAKRLTWQGRHLNQFLNLSSFAEQMVVHEHALVKIRPDMPLDLASLIGCSVITGYGAVVHTARIEPGSTVAVFGAGGIGLATINAAQIAGAARIVAIDKDPFKLDLARRFGATDVIDASEGDTVKRVVALTGGGVQYSFECIGLKATAEQSFSALRSGGTATLIGMIPVGTRIELHGVDFLRERRIQGCMMGSNRFRTDMPRLIEFYLQGRTWPRWCRRASGWHRSTKASPRSRPAASPATSSSSSTSRSRPACGRAHALRSNSTWTKSPR
jgi:S-(hydroxymethyl)glutathione dehydrogenase/alcohol dehydrogenase